PCTRSTTPSPVSSSISSFLRVEGDETTRGVPAMPGQCSPPPSPKALIESLIRLGHGGVKSVSAAKRLFLLPPQRLDLEPVHAPHNEREHHGPLEDEDCQADRGGDIRFHQQSD